MNYFRLWALGGSEGPEVDALEKQNWLLVDGDGSVAATLKLYNAAVTQPHVPHKWALSLRSKDLKWPSDGRNNATLLLSVRYRLWLVTLKKHTKKINIGRAFLQREKYN